jgi:AcrR family transcriptional regulator
VPTGVPIRNVREQLFDAARRVLGREGPAGLTSRAVTTEAGLAKGIVHRHFADFDTFLASLVVDRIEALDRRSERLRASAGSGTVAGNVEEALVASLDADALAIVGLVLSRRGLLARLRLVSPSGIPLLAEVTRMVAAYLTAERGLGRIAISCDVDRCALALVGGAHLLLAGADVPAVSGVRGFVASALAEATANDGEPWGGRA